MNGTTQPTRGITWAKVHDKKKKIVIERRAYQNSRANLQQSCACESVVTAPIVCKGCPVVVGNLRAVPAGRPRIKIIFSKEILFFGRPDTKAVITGNR